MTDIQPLIEYVQQNRRAGVSDEETKSTLLQDDTWSEEEIDSALNHSAAEPTSDLSQNDTKSDIKKTPILIPIVLLTIIIAGFFVVYYLVKSESEVAGVVAEQQDGSIENTTADHTVVDQTVGVDIDAEQLEVTASTTYIDGSKSEEEEDSISGSVAKDAVSVDVSTDLDAGTQDENIAKTPVQADIVGTGAAGSYLVMHDEFTKVKNYADLEAFMMKYGSSEKIAEMEAGREQLDSLPPEFKENIVSMMLQNVPFSQEFTDISEKIDGNNAVLTITTNASVTGTITMVLENGVWKLVESSWSNKL